MAYAKSPVNYTPPTGTLGYQPGTFTSGTSATSGASANTGSAGSGNAGAALGQIAPLITPEEKDVLETDNFIGKYAQGKALQFGAQGMQYGGPVGAAIGATAGLGYGLIKGQDIQFDALNAEQYQMGYDAKKEANKQELQMKNTKYDTTSAPSTKYGVVKKLGAITGTVANNMSVAQYKDEKKFSAIAKNMDEPIMNLGFIKAKTLEKDPNATTMVVDGETMPIKN